MNWEKLGAWIVSIAFCLVIWTGIIWLLIRVF